MTYKIKDNDGIYYEIKDIKKFAKHIFQYHSIGVSLHQEKGCNFTVDDTFREKVVNLLKSEEKWLYFLLHVRSRRERRMIFERFCGVARTSLKMRGQFHNMVAASDQKLKYKHVQSENQKMSHHHSQVAHRSMNRMS